MTPKVFKFHCPVARQNFNWNDDEQKNARETTKCRKNDGVSQRESFDESSETRSNKIELTRHRRQRSRSEKNNTANLIKIADVNNKRCEKSIV